MQTKDLEQKVSQNTSCKRLTTCYNGGMKDKEYSLEATFKHQGIEQMLTNLTGVSRKGAIAELSCVMCKGDASSFRDPLSRKEYTISGMCQDCQDSVYGTEEA